MCRPQLAGGGAKLCEMSKNREKVVQGLMEASVGRASDSARTPRPPLCTNRVLHLSYGTTEVVTVPPGCISRRRQPLRVHRAHPRLVDASVRRLHRPRQSTRASRPSPTQFEPSLGCVSHDIARKIVRHADDEDPLDPLSFRYASSPVAVTWSFSKNTLYESTSLRKPMQITIVRSGMEGPREIGRCWRWTSVEMMGESEGWKLARDERRSTRRERRRR